MGPKSKSKKKVTQGVKRVNELARELEKSPDKAVKFSATRLRDQVREKWTKEGQMYFPIKFKDKVQAMVDALNKEGYGVSIRPMEASKALNISEKRAAKYIVIVMSGKKIDPSAKSAVPTKTELISRVERELLYTYFTKNGKEISAQEKMILLEETAKKINKNSSISALEEFDLIYRGVQAAIQQNPPDASDLRKRFGKLVALNAKVIQKIGDPAKDAGLPAAKKIIPVRQNPTQTPSAATKKPKKIDQLRALLVKGEGGDFPTEGLKKAHFNKLLAFYLDPGFKSLIDKRYMSLLKANIIASGSRSHDRSRQEQEKLTRNIKLLESLVLLYKQVYSQLARYAPDAESKARIQKEAKKMMGLKKHKDLMKYVSSQTDLMNKVNALKLTRAQTDLIYLQLNGNLNPNYAPRGQTVTLGSGAAAKKKADALKNIFLKYPQLMLNAKTVRTSKYYVKGKEAWAVELGTVEECARRRATDAITSGTNVPISSNEGREFRESLPKLYAKQVRDPNMDSKDYAKAYEQLRALSTGTQSRYNVTFPNSIAAGEFYSLIWSYGPAHGFSATDIKQKGKAGWVVSVTCPTEKTPAPIKDGAKPAATELDADPMSSDATFLESPKAGEPKPDATLAPVAGTKDLSLSTKTINWMSRSSMDPVKFRRLYNAQTEKYNARNTGTLGITGWNALLAPAQACADLTQQHLVALEQNRGRFKDDLKTGRLLGKKDAAKELKAYDAYLAQVKKINSGNLKDLEEIQAKIHYLETASPDKVKAIPSTIDGRNTYLPPEERIAAVSAYKKTGATWLFQFDEARHAKRVHAWLLQTNFDSERVYLSGKTVTIHGPKPEAKEKKKGDEPIEGEVVFSASENPATQVQIQEMVESVYAWADPEANRFLQDPTRVNSAGKPLQQVLESFAAQVSEEQLQIVLDYLDYETNRLSRGMPPSGEPMELTISRTADSAAVMMGIRLLYTAAGLDAPRFRPVIVNTSQAGNQYIRARGLPRAYVKPMKESLLPELNEEGYVSLQGGQQVYLAIEQKQQIEAALRTGKAANVIIYKDANEKQVDNKGAYALMQHLHARGWTNVGIQAWNPEKKISARAALVLYAVPPGYWDRPSILSVVQGRNVLMDSDALARLVKERENWEVDELLVSTQTENPRFVIPENGVKSIGGVQISIIDRVGAEITAAKSEGGKHSRTHMRLEEDRINRQRVEIEGVVNTPGTVRRIAYKNMSRAMAAAEVVQYWLRSQADMRVVSVEKGAVFRRAPYTRTYYLTISNPSTNAFENRNEAPMLVPATYRYQSSLSKRQVARSLLTSSLDRVRLELFLNGSGGQRADFYTTAEGEEGLRAYLRDSGFDMAQMYVTKLKSASEIPNEFRSSMSELEGSQEYVSIRLVIPQEEAVPAEISADSNQAKFAELTTTLYGRTDEALLKYYGRHSQRVKTILNYARNPGLLKEDWTIAFSRADGGSAVAEHMYFALSSSGMFPGGVSISDNRLTIRAPPQEEVLGGRRGYHDARIKHAAEVTGMLLGSMLPEAQERSRKFASNLFKRDKSEKYDVTFAMGERVSTIDAFTNRLSSEEGTDPFTISYGLFSDSMQQYIFNMYTSENKTAYAIELFNLDMKQSEEKAAAFDAGPSIVIMEGFLRMHSGFGLGKDWATSRPKYARRAREMYEVLGKYRRFEDFAEELKVSNAGIGAATAIYQYADIMASLAVSNNTSFEGWSPTKQKAYRAAVFNVMWRAIVANYLFESGPVLGLALPAKKKAMYEEYRGLAIDYFTGLGEHSHFTHNGKEYSVLQSLIVRSDGENLLCVPPAKPAPNVVRAVKGRQLRKTENGNFIWEIIDIPDTTIRINKYDSLGGLGVTGWHSGPVFQSYGNAEILKDKPSGGTHTGPPVKTPPVRRVKTTLGETWIPFVPVTYVGPTFGRFTTEAVWKYRKRDSPIVMGMVVPKEMLFENVKDPRLGTLTVDKVTVSVKGAKKKVTFILPPRHRYNKKRELQEPIDYPANVFKGRYASAYVWNNNVYVIDYINPADAPADPLEKVPQNARELYAATPSELKKKGFRRINIGRFDRGTGTIAFSKDAYAKEYSKHIYGQITLTPDMMREMTDEEVDKYFKDIEATKYSGFHYYSFVPPKTGERDTGASEEVIGSKERLLYLLKGKVGENEGGNIPFGVKAGKKKTKKVKKSKR